MAATDYETDHTLAEYLLLHYGSAEDVLGKLPGPIEACLFPTRVVQELLDVARLPAAARALDIGCAVGGSTFELTRHCREVYGIDSSQKFISAARRLAKHGHLSVPILIEGSITEPFEARVPSELSRTHGFFEVGDALHLPMDRGQFDVVLAANLLCRLAAPQRFLESLPQLVRGQLLLATPFSWMEEFTPKNAWLGAGDQNSSWDQIQEILSPYFELEVTINLPFVIREHARKFQYGISLGSRWIRRTATDLYWDVRYEKGDTPWDRGEAHPELIQWLTQNHFSGEVLVPGCGKGYDVNAIANTHTPALGIDISSKAIHLARQNSHLNLAQFKVANLFDLPTQWKQRFKGAFEHNCYCAISPNKRLDYVAALAKVLSPGADFLACFYLNPDVETSPPFSTSRAELDQLFAPYFHLEREWIPSRTYPNRQGRELFRLYRKRNIQL